MRWILFFIFSISLSFMAPDLYAQTHTDSVKNIGVIAKLSGMVKVLEEGSIKKKRARSGFEIKRGDMVITYGEATAIVALMDGSKIVLDGGSMVHFASAKEIDHKEGSIYYNIVKRDAKNSLNVKTRFAIIGIKGTTFIINDDPENGKNVALKEGLIGVQSMKEAFELHKKKVMDEYARFKAQQEAGFEAYKKQYEDEIVEHVKAFELTKGKSISFSGERRVDEKEFAEKTKKQFDYFENLINKM